MKHAIQHIHFVGIGGSGMSGIAEVLHNLGYVVSGSDAADSASLQRLHALGIRAFVGHQASQVGQADVLVASSAVNASNPEWAEAKARGIPVVPRAVMLAELMRFKHGIAVAGTHGKTTTTSLLASVMSAAGLDPTYVIGGKLMSAGTHAALGAGEHIVVEADESDASFLNLSPLQAIVTNIDEDHMVQYGHDPKRLHQAFVDFVHRLPFYGLAVVCGDDPGVQAVLPMLQRKVLTCGMQPHNALRAANVQAEGVGMRFAVHSERAAPFSVKLNLAGAHNVKNALAAIGIAQSLGIGPEPIQLALADFKGVGRRFQRVGEVATGDGGTALLIDDYGHHPVEVAATLAAARGAYPGRRLVLAFQPHRYSRTRDCFDDFVDVLLRPDLLLLTEVYAAGEPPIVGADARSLLRALRARGSSMAHEPVFVSEVQAMPKLLLDQLQAGDVVLCMGAGSIAQLPHEALAMSKVIASNAMNTRAIGQFVQEKGAA